MSRKRKGDPTILEEIENSVHDNLFDILYKIGKSSHFHKVWEIFNKIIQIKMLLDGLEIRISNLLEVFVESRSFGYI